MTAGDEERVSSGPQATEPLRPDPVPPHPAESEGIAPASPGDEPATDSADLAAADRPAETYAPSAAAPAYTAAPASRRSIMPAVLAVIGLVLVALLGANLYTLYNPPQNDRMPTMEREVASLKQQVGALPKVDLGPVQEQVAAVGRDVDDLKSQVKSAADTSEAAKAVANAATQAANDATGAAAPLDTKLTDLGKTVTDLGKTVTDLQDKVAALPKVDLGPINEHLAALDKRMEPLEAYFNAPKSTEQVTEARQNGSAAQTRAAPLAVIAQGVLAAIDGGRPFEPEAKALKSLNADPEALKALDAVAATGAATRADLIEGFKGVRDNVVIAAAPVSTGTVLDRMMANAQSLVKVSRTGAGSGGDAEAIASRIQADLDRGALSAAASEWDKLPEASKSRSADWAARLKARIAAEDAARSIQTAAVAALATQP